MWACGLNDAVPFYFFGGRGVCSYISKLINSTSEQLAEGDLWVSFLVIDVFSGAHGSRSMGRIWLLKLVVQMVYSWLTCNSVKLKISVHVVVLVLWKYCSMYRLLFVECTIVPANPSWNSSFTRKCKLLWVFSIFQCIPIQYIVFT